MYAENTVRGSSRDPREITIPAGSCSFGTSISAFMYDFTPPLGFYVKVQRRERFAVNPGRAIHSFARTTCA
jgi:hypothetical protein